ncbi:hypothetical protein [Profundibacter sp.]
MRHFAFTSMVLAATALLGACQAPQEVAKDYMQDCLWETRAKGSYKRATGKIGVNGLPVIVPNQGGDLRGALFINACIERRHIRAGTLPGVPEYDDGTGG